MNNKGFTPLIFLLFVPVILIVLFLVSTNGSLLTQMASPIETYERAKSDLADIQKKVGVNVNWQFDQKTKNWQAIGVASNCPEPLVFPSPVDMSLVSGILYPGQERGGDYKPHGGFRFDNRDDNNIEVRAIFDGYILKASRYEDIGGEVQNFLFYVSNCGIMVMHDHLLTLSPKLQEVFAKIPLNKNGDSRTTEVTPKVYVKKDEVLATAIGYKSFPSGYAGRNVFVDFGLYDLRKTNGFDYDTAFRSKHPNIDEYGVYAVCWFDYIDAKDASLVKSLPAGGHEGKVSDYCK
ncbi:hypothetical protein A2803_01275 [Candidatus Woesebacteria bacterium RIFCSPHIGHO2_01_FULL_44_21]|uniref:Uncharacterized protein n=1 Tax=Candidatus Woesebacteria bacterium RIFCSPHIGHO2_01_FULL_44_21 TaxID=1802503 RepID=A0A1F7YZ79_9BACT|nr:MAG: hypothetical protein A2803_01275 [Candidatus Woesebacteria bacterium RIFCSPHIGHO2_01_FULL_44_21]OGM70823.1 MAG: hypothetical protein A2897_05265 [Candidatus Woesebacteria bacterium RIFCSPLOWO2_01_FULL_44_24b]